MANTLRDLFFGGAGARRDLVETFTPVRTFADVILPAETRRALDHALTQIRKHDMIFERWGLAERHRTGLGLAFNFAGPPGTGKTICAEAVANALGRQLLLVRYAEMESMWAGNTGKNVSAVFRYAEEEDAVLFFDEADAIAGRRFTAMDQGYQREANTVVNVLLRELEEFPGVVIFATNLAANFDPAFERRIRTHILFRMPDVEDREQIWRVQIHPVKTPLAEDVDFRALAEEFPVSGGDIKNAVLNAAQIAIAEPGPDSEKRIHQEHFREGMREVLSAKSIMGQSLYDEAGDAAMMGPLAGPWSTLAEAQDTLQGEVAELIERLDRIEGAQRDLMERVEVTRAETQRSRVEAGTALEAQRESAREVIQRVEAGWRWARITLSVGLLALILAVVGLVLALVG